LINKLFPVAKFQYGITSIDDVQPGELLGIQMVPQNLLARVDRVDRDHKKISLILSERNFELPGAKSAILYFYRPHLGDAQMHGTLYPATRGNAQFQLEGDRIETTGQPRLMAQIELKLTLTSIGDPAKSTVPVRPSTPPQRLAPHSATQNASPHPDDSPAIIKGKSELISERAILFSVDVSTPLTAREKRIERWQMDLILPDSTMVLKLFGKLLPSRKDERYIFRIETPSENVNRILAALIHESAPVPEKLV